MTTTDINTNNVALRVSHVSKSFRLPTEQASGLKQAFINWTRGIRGYKDQEVLRDISFTVHKGDFLGIVGRNGSGKSTLLKLISGIYTPNSGDIEVHGKLVPFIELGVGFNPELTGRENVYLNGALLGFSEDEVTAMYDDIVDFAELGDFMDQKLKNYSSGMQVRLAFSVAIKAQGDILVLDEVLAVGDEAFQTKCNNFFNTIKKDKTKTVILVTHSMDSVKKYCNKAILIRDGRIIVNGDKDEAANLYTQENIESLNKNTKDTDNHNPDSVYPSGLNATVPFFRCLPDSDVVLTSNMTFKFTIQYEFTRKERYFLALSLLDTKRGGIPYDTGSIDMGMGGRGRRSIQFSLPLHLFNNGDYKIVASLRVQDPEDDIDTKMVAFTNDDNSCAFSIREDSRGTDYALLKYAAVDMKHGTDHAL